MRFPDDPLVILLAGRILRLVEDLWGVMWVVCHRTVLAAHPGDHTIVMPSPAWSPSWPEVVNPVMNLWRVPPPW
ncbi:hypothetical protein [Streptomyces anulatus]|uniref:hypothetical protein n=1 Tax=Streptomyces anulatus TaxID=1892 RepID=UPI003447BFF4